MSIKDIGIKDLIILSNLAGKANVTKEWINEQIRKYNDGKKYFGYIPKNKELSIALSKAESSGAYHQLVSCVGKDYLLLRFFVIGLYIHELNKEGRRKRINEIRGEIHEKYRKPGLHILNISSTGALPSIIKYLNDLKVDENLSRYELQGELDKIRSDWDRITIFVTNKHILKEVEGEIVNKMDSKERVFFVFGIGGPGKAGLIAASAIANLHNEELIRKKGYSWPIEGNRTEQADGVPMFSWRFTLRKK